jgi:hypothetical protein
MARRPYEELRSGIEQLGGSMIFEKHGYQWGAWIVTLDGQQAIFQSNGRGFPDIDVLYVPLTPDPQHYRDYSCDLVEGAIEKLVAKLT